MSGPKLKTGFFVLSGLTCFALVAIVLAKFDWFSDASQYIVRFTINDGVMGLGKGSAVQVGGLSRGSVESVHPIYDATGVMTSLDVHISLENDVTLYANAQAMRLMPLLGTVATLNFVSIGDGDKRLAAGSTINAVASGGILATLLGPTNAMKSDQIVENALQFSVFLAKVPGDYETKVVPMIDNAVTVIAEFRTDYSDWRTKIGVTLTSAQGSMQKLDSSLTEVQQLVARNGPKIDTTLANLDVSVASAKDALHHLNQETIPLIDSTLRHTESAVDEFGKSIELVHALLLERSPDIAETLSSIRTAAGQMKLASMEIRRSPWKILYQPSSDQVAHENLYESARSFAMAAGDLRAAGDALRLVIERDPGKYDADMKFRDAVQAMVLDAIAKYELAQQQLNSVLMAPAPAGESKAK